MRTKFIIFNGDYFLNFENMFDLFLSDKNEDADCRVFIVAVTFEEIIIF